MPIDRYRFRSIGKLIGSVSHDQVPYRYLDVLPNILYSKQIGFRNNHSTALVFVDLINNISSAIDRKETTLGIFLDLSRTFDAINHEILCQKLQHYGIQDTALVWIKSYLEDQTQFVHRAQFLDLFCLLFTLMIFLMSLVSLNLYCLLMIQVSFVPIKMPTTSFLLLTNFDELAKIIIWLKVNKLSLNLTETNFMIFHPRQKKVNVNVPLTLENTVIKQVTETKFLGILIDQHLSWNPHIDFASKKILKSVGIIAKAHFYLSSQTLMTLYYSLVYPFLAYCSNLNCI